jgi:periplasmic divalent cation tolerance protein
LSFVPRWDRNPPKWTGGTICAVTRMLIVLTTLPNIAEAETLAERIVGEKLAACVQVLPQIASFYFWEGKVQKEGEYLLLIKTLGSKYEALQAFILENHSYEVPEVVAITAERASDPYLAWAKNYLEK